MTQGEAAVSVTVGGGLPAGGAPSGATAAIDNETNDPFNSLSGEPS
jgi:hypothetical protein